MAGTTLSSRRAWAVMGAACLAAALVVGGASLAARPRPQSFAVDVLAALQSGATVDPVKRLAAREELLGAYDGRVRAQAGVIALNEARQEGVKGTRKEAAWLATASDDFRNGLLQTPLNPFAWAYLSSARTQVDGPTDRAIRSFEMSLYTGKYVTELAPLQMALAASLWDRLEAPTRGMVLRLIAEKLEAGEPRIQALRPFAASSAGRAILQEAQTQNTVAGHNLAQWLAKVDAPPAATQ